MSWFSKAVKRNTKWAKNKAKKLKKTKLKDILSSDVLTGALSMVPGGGLVSGALSKLKTIDNLIPSELKSIKGSDILASVGKGSTVKEAVLDKIADEAGFVRQGAATARGSITFSSKSTKSTKSLPPVKSAKGKK